MKIEIVRDLVNKKNYSISKHAFTEAFADGFSLHDILIAIRTGEIIEEYPDRNRLLIYAKLGSDSIHVVVDYSTSEYIWIVTVYRPDPKEWIGDKVRKEL